MSITGHHCKLIPLYGTIVSTVVDWKVEFLLSDVVLIENMKLCCCDCEANGVASSLYFVQHELRRV